MNDPLDQKLSAHFHAQKAAPLPGGDFSARVLTALPPAKPAAEARPFRWLKRILTWDTGLAVTGAVVAMALCLPFGDNDSALDLANRALASIENWPALPSFGLALGLTVATAYLFGNEEERDDEAI